MRVRGHRRWIPVLKSESHCHIEISEQYDFKRRKEPLLGLKKIIRKIIKREERRKLGDHPKWKTLIPTDDHGSPVNW